MLLFVERLLLAGGAEGREGRRWLLGGVLVGAARCWHRAKEERAQVGSLGVDGCCLLRY